MTTLIAKAQTAWSGPPRRVLWLGVGAPDSPEEVRRYESALAQAGWVVGKNVLIERRDVRFQDLASTAKGFVDAKVDLIVTNGTEATLAAKNATATIPILMWGASDPVGSGLVASLAHPGGNITGYALLGPELLVKRVSLLQALMPGIRRVAEFDDARNAGVRIARPRLEAGYQSLGMEAVFIDTFQFKRFDDMFAEVRRQRAQALHIIEDTMYLEWLPPLLVAATASSLPTVVASQELLQAGALLSYHIDEDELLRRFTVLFDRLLRGRSPAALPVEQPSTFILGVNLRTAKALQIVVPPSLLLRADRVLT